MLRQVLRRPLRKCLPGLYRCSFLIAHVAYLARAGRDNGRITPNYLLLGEAFVLRQSVRFPLVLQTFSS